MLDDIEPLKKIVKGSSFVILGILLSKFLTYIYRLLVARIGPEQYGLFSLSLAITGTLTIISLLGLNTGVLRYIPFFKGKGDNEKILLTIRESLKITFFLGLAFSILTLVFSEEISLLFFNNTSLAPILRVMSFSILFGALVIILHNIMIAFQKIKQQVLIKNLFENLVKIILTFVFIYILSYGILGAAYGYLISLALSSVASIFIINRKIFEFLDLKEIKGDKILRNEMLLYSLPLLLTGLMSSVILWTDSIILGHFRSFLEVGIYNAAMPTAQLMYVIPYAFTVLFLPVLTELYAQENLEMVKSIYSRVTKWIFFMNFILLSFLLLFSEKILILFFGGEYSAGSTPLLILSFGFFIGYMLEPTQKILIMLKRTKNIFLITALLTLFNLVFNLILIPRYGITGAAIATSSSYILSFLLFSITSYPIIKVNPIKLKFVLSALFLGIILYIMKVLSSNNLFFLVISLIAYICITFLLLSLVKIFEKEDILLIKMILRKIRSQLN